MADLLTRLKNIVRSIDDRCSGGCSPCGDSCCKPCAIRCAPTFPFATVTMTIPPPIVLPTVPAPIKPLQLPCSCPPCPEVRLNHNLQLMETIRKYIIIINNWITFPPIWLQRPFIQPRYRRYDHFYNNYNVIDGIKPCCPAPPQKRVYKMKCEDYSMAFKRIVNKHCPTGYKVCTMKLKPPPLNDPCGVWCAKIMPCPPKKHKVSNVYRPGCCFRPCCLHWKEKCPCIWDFPCKAHCYNQYAGQKPRTRGFQWVPQCGPRCPSCPYPCPKLCKK